MNQIALTGTRDTAFSWSEVCEAIEAPLPPATWLPELDGVSTDTRTLRPGELFFALTGPCFDGHDYVAEAAARGAGGMVVARGRSIPDDVDPSIIVTVEDPHQALAKLGGFVRSRWDGRLVAVTGSYGKTTTKEMVGRVLGDREQVLVAPGTENNLIGVPRLLARLKPSHRFAVIEMGTSQPGEIADLTRIADPEVAVITGIGAAHLEGLKDLDGVAREKGSILNTWGSARVAVLHGDDPRVRALGELARTVSDVQCVYYGLTEGNDVQATDVEPDGRTMRFRIEGKRIHLPLLGRHNVLNALAAYTVGRELGIRPTDLRERLESQGPVQQRMVPILCGDCLIIDDTYNANPPAMRAALQVLKDLEVTGRRILVAGEMRELGVGAEVLHREIGKAASDSGIDVLWAVGPLAIFYLEGARESLPARAMQSFENASEVADALPAFLRPGDAVLVKGSRAMGLEHVVQAVRERTARCAL